MDVAELLTDAFGRVRETVHAVLDGIDTERLHAGPDSGANPVAWLVWHLTRVQDDHVCAVAGVEQTWTAGGFARRFALPLDDADTKRPVSRTIGRAGDRQGALRSRPRRAEAGPRRNGHGRER